MSAFSKVARAGSEFLGNKPGVAKGFAGAWEAFKSTVFPIAGSGGDSKLGAVALSPGTTFDLFISTLFINLLGLALPLMLLQVYDRIVPNPAERTLVLLVLGVGVAFILEAFLRTCRSYVTGWMGARFEHKIGCRIADRFLSANITDFEKDGPGVQLERMNSVSTLREFYSGQALLILCDLPFVLIFLAIIAYLAGYLILVPIVLIVLFGAAAIHVGLTLRESLSERTTADTRRFNFIIEVLGGIHTVKSMAMEEQMVRRYERLQETCAEANRKTVLQSVIALSTGSLFSQLTFLFVVGFGAIQVIDGSLTIGGLAACTLLSGRCVQPLQRAIAVWTRFQTIRLARDRVDEVFSLGSEENSNLPPLPAVAGEIEFRGVSFRYQEDGPNILDNVSLKIAPGEAVGICGTNSSGKSTLLSLMVGVIRPSEGSTLIDGNDLTQFDPSSFNGSIAYLPQDAVLFNGTIMENLTMFRPDREQKARRAAQMSDLHDMIIRIPQGYDSKVGDGAYDWLPRGFKQRIAIARALVDDPRIFLFDEANTALDGAGDLILNKFLASLKGKQTLVLVSHRPSILKLCDRIYDLKDGHLTLRKQESSKVRKKPLVAVETHD